MIFIIAVAIMGSLLLVIVITISPKNIGQLVDLHLLRRRGKPERVSFAESSSLNRDLTPALSDPLGEPPVLANRKRWLRQVTGLVCITSNSSSASPQKSTT